MNIKCIIIDDEPLAIKVLEQHIGKTTGLELIATFENAVLATEAVQSLEIDLMFLDIEMPLITGIDFIKNTNIQAKVILTTAYREYAIEGYELDVVDYLLKPISFSRFFKSVNKYKDSLNRLNKPLSLSDEKEPTNHIFVNSNKRYLKIEFSNILYIDSLKDYIRIHTDKKTITTKDKLSSFTEKLPNTFLRVHRSFIVNKEKITAFNAKDIEIGNIEIPIGESYKQSVKLLKTQ